jgi:hypothetical protein
MLQSTYLAPPPPALWSAGMGRRISDRYLLHTERKEYEKGMEGEHFGSANKYLLM